MGIDVFRAWELVKANDGAEGVDGETIEQFESNLKGNLYQQFPVIKRDSVLQRQFADLITAPE